MKIVEVEYLAPPALGGVEAVVKTLSHRFIHEGHQVEIWATDLASFAGPRLPLGRATEEGLILRRFGTTRDRFYLLDPYHLRWSGLASALVDAAADGAAIHVHPFPSSQALLALDAVRAGAGVVITPHHEVESLRRYRRLWRSRTVLGKVVAAARQYANLRLGLHTEVEQAFWRDEIGWPAEQMRVIPNGVDPREFDRVHEDELAAAGERWPEHGVRVLYAGRLDRSKGIDLIVRALAGLTDASLLIAGPDAGARPELEALTAALGLQERVRFAGPLPRAALCALFRACDIFALPSRYGENFGMVAIEAMAAGKPVVVSDCGGLPSLVRQRENGLIVPVESVDALGAALAELAASPELRRQYGAAGRRAVAIRFSWERVAEAYLGLLSAAAKAGKARAGS